jgi:hypothetical protein
MSETKSELKSADSHQRELVVAYLSYALDDVQAVSAVGLQLLQMTIAAITEEAAAKDSRFGEAPVMSCH